MLVKKKNKKLLIIYLLLLVISIIALIILKIFNITINKLYIVPMLLTYLYFLSFILQLKNNPKLSYNVKDSLVFAYFLGLLTTVYSLIKENFYLAFSKVDWLDFYLNQAFFLVVGFFLSLGLTKLFYRKGGKRWKRRF